jgi:hypothetical protein
MRGIGPPTKIRHCSHLNWQRDVLLRSLEFLSAEGRSPSEVYMPKPNRSMKPEKKLYRGIYTDIASSEIYRKMKNVVAQSPRTSSPFVSSRTLQINSGSTECYCLSSDHRSRRCSWPSPPPPRLIATTRRERTRRQRTLRARSPSQAVVSCKAAPAVRSMSAGWTVQRHSSL